MLTHAPSAVLSRFLGAARLPCLRSAAQAVMQPAPARKAAMIAAYHEKVAITKALFALQPASLPGEQGTEALNGPCRPAPEATSVGTMPILLSAA